MQIKNIFSDIAESFSEEVFDTIVENKHFKLERIVSSEHSTPERHWYDQDADEWVIVIKGAAGISFKGEAGVQYLQPGDYIHIPAHVKHRVAWTKENEKTIWLALHYKGK